SDSDGLNDGDEVLNWRTDPTNPDSDGDGLNDFKEVIELNTNAINPDTDEDGLSDGEEVLKYGTNPLKPDSDNDDLSDSLEIIKYKTNPLRSDTDGDGLSDGAEVNIYLTDPTNLDSDLDGLSDGEEIIKFGTNPLDRDTDNGSVDDFTEIHRETNPLDPDDDIIQMNVPIVLDGITFATGKAEIEPQSEFVLRSALETLMKNPDIIIEISGHTDNVGSENNNRTLSQKRADAVRFWLIRNGIAPDRILAKGYGEDFPRVPNDTDENRRINRRIEFKRIR
ncbi:MAG: OmpA family protein, partial [Ignavibacteriaceae bacterium]|nr:OmpA family protein [Ignavibacteriaceae bacterium]